MTAHAPVVRSPSFLPLAIAAMALTLASPMPEVGFFALLVIVTSLVIGQRLVLDRASLRLASVVAIVLVIAYVRATTVPLRGMRLGAFGLGFTLAVLMVGALRLYVTKPEWGEPFTIALGLVAVFACGGARLGATYGAIVLVHLAASLYALRAGDPDRVVASRIPRRVIALGASVIGVACAIAVAFGVVAPAAHSWTQRRFEQAYDVGLRSKVGFSRSVQLGDLAPLMDSDEMVLRIRGQRVDYLRGAVLDTYEAGRWSRSLSAPAAPSTTIAVARGTLEGRGFTEIRRLRDGNHVTFLPLDVEELATPSGTLRVDDLGAAKDGGDDRVALRTRARELLALAPPDDTMLSEAGTSIVRALTIAPPSADDLAVPSRLRTELARMATEWTRDARTPAQAVAALQRKLKQEHAYELVASPRVNGDPILDFLVRKRAGHCEYFASALALLARSIGIPTRVVTGYRVGERHELLEHWVVRENNAHAWVEAFVPERGWTTWDPTPMVELPQHTAHDATGTRAVTELFAAGWDRAEDWVAARSVAQLTAAALLGLAIFVVQRRLRARAPHLAELSPALRFSPPPPMLATLERACRKRGLGRAAGETLESWACRLPDTQTRDAILAYAAARYAGLPTREQSAALRAGA